MGNVTYEGENQKRIEIFVLIIHSVYSLGMCESFLLHGISNGTEFFLLLLLALNWIVCVSRCKDYEFRAYFSSLMMQGSVFVYSTQADEFSKVLPTFMFFTVLLGLYGFPKLIYHTIATIIIIFFYQVLMVNSIVTNSLQDLLRTASKMGNVFLLQFIVYTWTKRNSEGSQHLLDTIEELKVVERSKNDFLANVSHEIRTPINTICGMSELVLQAKLPYNVKEKVQSIERAGRNLMFVVGDILDYSELQSGKIELQEEAYNITSTINDVINMTIAQMSEKKVELIVDCDANIPRALLGDEKKIRRVIMNLVDNAIKFTNEGYVSIHISCRKESYGINLVIAVKDSGIGMEEKSLEKLFVEFSQVNSRRNRQEGGVGLGLAISYALVKTMGGAITVRSKIGKGSCVQFVVPQKVLDDRPVATIDNKENLNVATYIDMEQFDMVDIRDEYSKCIIHMVEQLKNKCHICRNLAELSRKEKAEGFSHVFVSIVEYQTNQEYFDELATRSKVVVVLDHDDEKYVSNPNVLKIYKPFYILTIVSVLNGSYDINDEGFKVDGRKFITRDAHVLVVDDNRMNIRVIEGLLENYEMKVTVANNGKEALEKIEARNYDFVFMDHMMPEMDGVETLHRIRHMVGTYYQKVPIIALTANAVAGTREMLIEEGFSDFLEKPVERSVLERVLKRNLPAEKIIYKDEQEERKEPIVNNNNQELERLNKGEGPDVTELEASLAEKGLDVRRGIVYCNGKEQYLKVLQGYCEDCDASELLAEELFAKEDWKNYVIAVHGMKSAMRSIGAEELAEAAKKLEFAGKEGRIGYIVENHEDLMQKYRELFASLKENPWIAPSHKHKKAEAVSEDDNVKNLPELSEDGFDRIVEDMEDAVYALDGEILLELVAELRKYQYRGSALSKQLASVQRKIEMSDYISALEMVQRLKDNQADEVK